MSDDGRSLEEHFEVGFYADIGGSSYLDAGTYSTFAEARAVAREAAYVGGFRAMVIDWRRQSDRILWRWDSETSVDRAAWCDRWSRWLLRRADRYQPGSDRASALPWAAAWQRSTWHVEACAICTRATDHRPLGHEWDAPCCSIECAEKLAMGFVENLERDALLDLFGRDWLPARAAWDELETLGFEVGPVTEDPLFRRAGVPTGWRKARASDDYRIFYALDERGIRRLTVLYAAAPYHRNATCMIVDVGREAADEALYSNAAPALPRYWAAMTSTERDAFLEVVKGALKAPKVLSLAAGENTRARKILELARRALGKGAP